MSKRGKNTLDVAGLVVEVTENMSHFEKFRFEKALVELIPQTIRQAAEMARETIKPAKRNQHKRGA